MERSQQIIPFPILPSTHWATVIRRELPGNQAPAFLSPRNMVPPCLTDHAAAMFYSGTVFPQFKNNFLFGGLKGEGVFHVVFSAENPESIIEYERLPDINVGRVRAITEGPDGLRSEEHTSE